MSLSLKDEDHRRSMVFDTGWDTVTDCRFDPSGRFCAVSGGIPGSSGGVIILDVKNKAILSKLDWPGMELVTAVDWNLDGSCLVVAGFDSVIRTF